MKPDTQRRESSGTRACAAPIGIPAQPGPTASARGSRFRLAPIALAQAIGVGCGIVGVKVNSRIVPPDALGAYGVFLAFAPIGSWVVHAGVAKFVARHWAASPDKARAARHIVRAWLRRLPWLMVLAAIATIMMAPLPGSTAILGGVLFAGAGLLAFTTIAQTALQADGAHWRDCAVATCGSLSRTFAPPLAFLAAGGAIDALWLGFGAHTVLGAAAAGWAFRHYWRAPPTNTARPEAPMVYDGPLFVVLAAASWLLSGLNRWVVAAFFGPIEAGYFTLAGGAAVVLASTIATVLVQYFQPGVFALGDAPALPRVALARRIDAVAAFYTVAAGAVVGAFAWGAPWLVGPLIDPTYEAGLGWALPGGFFAIATGIAFFYHILLLASRRESACGMVDLTTAATLAIGSVIAASFGIGWLQRWLVLTPIVPWLLTRSLARSFALRPDAASAPATAR